MSGSSLDKFLPDLKDAISFEPSTGHRQVKAALWVVLSENPLFADPDALSAEEVARLTNNKKVLTWWNLPGFREWLLNKNELKTKIDTLFHAVLDSCLFIAASDDTKSFSAKVNLLKVLADLQGLTKKTEAPKSLDLPDDPEELKLIIERGARKLTGN